MTMWRRLRLLTWPLGMLCVSGALSGLLVPVADMTGGAAPAASTCTSRLLVLSAMPLELDPILARAIVDPGAPVVLDDRPFVTGTLGGRAVIMGLTGIGPANALAVTTAAFGAFVCDGAPEISGVVFSGTSGGDFIGDVFVPQDWTQDGTTLEPTDPAMLATARAVAGGVHLERTTPTGDPACLCTTAGGIQTPVTVTHTSTVEFGGTGLTTDPVGGRTLPCGPAGSDILGCVPCREMDQSQLSQALSFAEGVTPFVDPGFFTGFLEATTPPGSYVSSDEETAVVAEVAARHGVPFIGFRAASDGPGNTPGTGGDPLLLPGFPAQFAVYRQLAADNAAAMAVAFTEAWSG